MTRRIESTPPPQRRIAQFVDARSGRPGWMRAFNSVGRLMPGISPRAASQWLELARKDLPRADVPSPDAVRALTALVDSLRGEGQLNWIGRIAAKDDTVRMARNHLRITSLIRDRPEILETEFPPPIFIIGAPRTGTTFLHQLLSQDPRSRTIPYWESFDPVPPEHGPDRRANKVDKMLRQLEGMAPDYHAIHPMEANAAEECVALFMNELRSLQFDIQYRAPSYVRWLLAEDARIAYTAYQRQLRIIQFFRPTGDRFVLKDPTHLVHLDTVLEIFPDAKIIFTHRDPAESLSSICSLYAHTRAIFSDAVDPVAIGREIIGGYWPEAVDHMRRVRAGLPDAQYTDVRQSDLSRDPMATVKRLYLKLGIEFDSKAEAGINRFLAARSRRPRDVHEHRPEGFGLTATQMRDHLKGYVEAFDL